MTEYQKPYLILWAAIGKALAEMKERNYGLARSILLKAQVEAEEAYLSWPDGCDMEEKKDTP